MALDLAVVGKHTEAHRVTYTWKDVVLYALGIGAKKDELDYLFEGKGPKVIPSFAVVPEFAPMFEALRMTNANFAMVVFGGERVVAHKPFPADATVTARSLVRGIYDLRKMAQVVIDTEISDLKGEKLATTTSSIICRGEGGFGGEPPPKEDTGIAIPSDRPPPTFRIEEQTSPEQALLYRLSGDVNPLHADPDFAKSVGFDRGPILHGLATYGFMVRHAAKGVCGGDATRLTAFETQFRKPVWPGETLVTEGWVIAPGKVALRVSVKEREETVVAGSWATFRDA
jgi:acyl dehydratase